MLVYELSETINRREADAINNLCADLDLQYFAIDNLSDIGWYSLCIQTLDADMSNKVSDLCQSVGVTCKMEVFEDEN